jgi:hypothetical protein
LGIASRFVGLLRASVAQFQLSPDIEDSYNEIATHFGMPRAANGV